MSRKQTVRIFPILVPHSPSSLLPWTPSPEQRFYPPLCFLQATCLYTAPHTLHQAVAIEALPHGLQRRRFQPPRGAAATAGEAGITREMKKRNDRADGCGGARGRMLRYSRFAVAPSAFLERTRPFETSYRLYLLKYGAPRHSEVIVR